MNLALKMTIKYYYQADFWNTSWRLLECVLERKCFTNTQFMNFTTKKFDNWITWLCHNLDVISKTWKM